MLISNQIYPHTSQILTLEYHPPTPMSTRKKRRIITKVKEAPNCVSGASPCMKKLSAYLIGKVVGLHDLNIGRYPLLHQAHGQPLDLRELVVEEVPHRDQLSLVDLYVRIDRFRLIPSSRSMSGSLRVCRRSSAPPGRSSRGAGPPSRACGGSGRGNICRDTPRRSAPGWPRKIL